MGSAKTLIIPLDQAGQVEESLVGGKCAKLVRMMQSGIRVPAGCCLSTNAYLFFLRFSGLKSVISRELERKPFSSMRWEELWDAALRIRTAFLRADLPLPIIEAVRASVGTFRDNRKLAVRSSSPSEDSKHASFAGLHESFLDICSEEELFRAIRLVWASLWSDASLLYRQELGLDVKTSTMAVLIQEMIERDYSGVAFGCDPRQPELKRAIIEVVPGRCSDLVDGSIDPDRWILERPSGSILEYRSGERAANVACDPFLSTDELSHLYKLLLRVEDYFAWTADIEWTGRSGNSVVLQARPVSTLVEGQDDKRKWYLELRLQLPRLRKLAEEVSEVLIPKLDHLGKTLAAENLDQLCDAELAAAIEKRLDQVNFWRTIYTDKFIPFAHGVRFFGAYYNTFVQPQDAFEFAKLLLGEKMLAGRRNEALFELASQIYDNGEFENQVAKLAENWEQYSAILRETPKGSEFFAKLSEIMNSAMDVTYGGERIASHPQFLIRTILAMAEKIRSSENPLHTFSSNIEERKIFEERFFKAVGDKRRDEAQEVLRIARLSWRLRDDDSLLLGRVESQCLRALQTASARLKEQGRLREAAKVRESDSAIIISALKSSIANKIELVQPDIEKGAEFFANPAETPRQLVGQPASPGFCRGLVRCIRKVEDMSAFRSGEILVCDSIQPMMTQLVPLAAGIIERRGGMLIHGAIIARELHIPCVNGVPHAVELLEDGQLVTVDGDLGIVTVGLPELSLEEEN